MAIVLIKHTDDTVFAVLYLICFVFWSLILYAMYALGIFTIYIIY